ncbi:MAG TPA: RING finger domain-containing protein [Rhabdochlamydiaceae bacterium]|nr:RING finger domain-containing protein [Rhabdochlamydiaceae bacterium]
MSISAVDRNPNFLDGISNVYHYPEKDKLLITVEQFLVPISWLFDEKHYIYHSIHSERSRIFEKIEIDETEFIIRNITAVFVSIVIICQFSIVASLCILSAACIIKLIHPEHRRIHQDFQGFVSRENSGAQPPSFAASPQNQARPASSSSSPSAAPSAPASKQLDKCAICLEPMKKEDLGNRSIIRHLECFHRFHTDCISPWVDIQHKSCPICKTIPTRESSNDSRIGSIRDQHLPSSRAGGRSHLHGGIFHNRHAENVQLIERLERGRRNQVDANNQHSRERRERRQQSLSPNQYRRGRFPISHL